MDFGWTDEQIELRDSVREFAHRELDHDVARHDRDGTFPREAWKRCAGFGIQGLTTPAEYGGAGLGPLGLVIAMEALGYACRDNGLLFSLSAQLCACQHPLSRFGDDAQKRGYLPRLADGSLIAAHAMSEPGAGSDAFSLTTTAVPTDDGYVLNGSKTFVTNAPVAGLFVLFARTDASSRLQGITAFLVDRDTPGLTVGAPLHKMGLRTSPMSEVFLADCEVPTDAVLGHPGSGMAIFNAAMEFERSVILASTIGTMERSLEQCVGYARERTQFGQPIGRFQAVSHRVADMKVRLEAGRLLLYELGWRLEQGRPAGLGSALTKLFLSEAFVQSSHDALQVHGGYGYMAELEYERDVRDATGSRLYSGTSDIQRNLIARYLGV